MKSTVLICFFALAICNVYAQQPQWTVTLNSTGSDQESLGHSNKIIGSIQADLNASERVAVRGQIRSGIRSEAFDLQSLNYAKELNAEASTTLQFQPLRPGRTVGYVHLSATSIKTGEHGVFVQYLDAAEPQSWQYREMSSWITSFVSGQQEIIVYLYMYTRPSRAFFEVGQARPEVTDEQGRRPEEGFKLWVGTRPEGATDITIYKPPDYEPLTKSIQITRSGGGNFCKRPNYGFCEVVDVELQRKPGN